MDEQAADRYLRQRVPIPAALRIYFGDAHDLPRGEAAATLSAAMRLRADEQSTLVVGLMLVLLEAIARAVQDGSRVPEDRGGKIAEIALGHYTVDECLEISAYFGGDHVAIPPGTTLGSLSNTVHELLCHCIGDPLSVALTEWSGDE
jgi:hypothetical protein